MRRRRKTEGVLLHRRTQAPGAALRQPFEIVEQDRGVAEAGEDFLQRLHFAKHRQLQARGEDEGQAEDLAGALVDQQVDAVFGGDDLGFETGAGFGQGLEFLEAERVFDIADEFAQVIARDFAQPRDGVEREQDAREDEEQRGHGLEYRIGA